MSAMKMKHWKSTISTTKVSTISLRSEPPTPKPPPPPRDFASAFHPLFVVSRALGVAPFGCPDFGKSRVALGVSVGIGVVSLSATVCSLQFMGAVFLSNPTRNRWMLPRLLVYALLFATAACALGVAVSKSRRTFRKIAAILTEVDVALFAARVDYDRVHSDVCVVLLLALVVEVLVLVVDGYLTFAILSVGVQLVEMAKNLMLVVGDCTTLQFVGTVLFVKTRLRAVNAQLSELFRSAPQVAVERDSVIVPKRLFARPFPNRLSALRTAHAQLCEAAAEMNAYFGLPMACKTTVNLFTVISHVHSALVRVKTMTGTSPSTGQGHGHDTEFLVSSVLWVAYSTGMIVAVAHCCHTTAEVAAEAGVVVQECLLVENLTGGDVERLDDFSDQIARSPLKWTACGLFSLDLSLLLGVVATVTSYIIIMEQQ